jgi:hypothetical protein
MGAPLPPQGNQQLYTERPLRVFGEQYRIGAPLPIGVLTQTPTGEATPPYAIAAGKYYPVTDTDWIISNRYTGALLEVISAEEFAERFGPGAPLETA